MRTVDAEKIEFFLQDHVDRNATPPLYFSPAADNKTAFLPAEYVARGRAGRYANVVSNILLGWSFGFARLTICDSQHCWGQTLTREHLSCLLRKKEHLKMQSMLRL